MKTNKWTSKVNERILVLRKEGKTRREIADELNLTVKQIENFVTRINKKEAQIMDRIASNKSNKVKSNPLISETEKDKEIMRLKMENDLLRDFLQIAGRK